MATAAEVIAAAQALIGTESDWCSRANARDSAGLPCSIFSPNAVRFDVYGSILKALDDLSEGNVVFHEVYGILRSNIPEDFKNRDIESYNDESSYALAYALFGGPVEVTFLATDDSDEVVTDELDNISVEE